MKERKKEGTNERTTATPATTIDVLTFCTYIILFLWVHFDLKLPMCIRMSAHETRKLREKIVKKKKRLCAQARIERIHVLQNAYFPTQQMPKIRETRERNNIFADPQTER